MKTFKPFFLIIVVSIIGMVYVTVANKTNFYTQNTLKSSERLHVQKNKVNRLKTEIADILASKASSYQMVKIPVRNMPAEHRNISQTGRILASSK